MKILGIEHIGIAVKNLKTDAPFWKHILKIKNTSTEVVDEQDVITDIYDTSRGKVELLEATNKNSVISKFIDKYGPGIHHICFEVDNILEAIKELSLNNIEIIGEKPTVGAEGYKVIFIHPKSTGGVLVELAQRLK
tara:strand:- start:47 stop:454 length:408 start_codon:yes stop_codon:yes gene_type:complete